MINRVVLVGRLTKDLDLRRTPSGNSCVSYSLAVGRNRTQDGQQNADFIECVTWNKSAETMCQYLHKGSLIAIEGRIQTRSYDNQQGQRVYVTEVVTDSVQFLETKSSQQNYQQQYAQQNTYQQQSYQQANSYQPTFNDTYMDDSIDISSDDLPF